MLILYGHPFSSYTWKAVIPFYEKALPFTFRLLDAEQPQNGARLRDLWPVNKFPVLEDGDQVVMESSIIIEHLDLHHPGPRMIPADPAAALHVRLMDRLFDNHVQTPFQGVVGEHLPFITAQPDPMRIERARAALDAIYLWLEQNLPNTPWACGETFTLADCAAAPALFYTDWVHPIPDALKRLRAYRARLLARPSVARCVEEARPYRPLFPMGAPDRD